MVKNCWWKVAREMICMRKCKVVSLIKDRMPTCIHSRKEKLLTYLNNCGTSVLNCWFIYSPLLNYCHRMLENRPENLYSILGKQIGHYRSKGTLD